MYKYSKDVILRIKDSAFIPIDPDNRDYVEYLRWVEAGGVTLPEFTAEELESIAAEKAKAAESEWRSVEMQAAQQTVTAIEFGDESVPGTAADWKAYWLSLRAWKEGAEGWPDSAHRPARPA